MIVFDLHCGAGHVFEAWFGDSGDFERQKKRKLLSCPICGDGRVDKAPMAPHLAPKSGRQSRAALAEKGGKAAVMAPPMSKALMDLLGRVQRHVEDNFDYVGDRFAEEARRIHEGEAPQRGIFGEATLAESRALREDGIPVMPMPMPAKPRRSDA
ncbi:MAG: DUF1178 family protein [Alphaproteobacteria bacterium]|nr:MAG: DUF1178 family protein [Alphaproteobacteria bacterium]